MKINLRGFKDKSRCEPPEELILSVFEHYSGVLNKYGYQRRHGESFDQIARYFARYYAGKINDIKLGVEENYSPPEKGLIIFGMPGVGKTFAMQIFSGVFDIEFLYADDIVREYAKYGEKGFWSWASNYDYKEIVIDDIGAERDLKSYGNESVFVEFLCRRERQYRERGVLTHFTTNAGTRDDLKDKYGVRVMSRILGMCQPVMIKGDDYRISNDGYLFDKAKESG